VATTNSRDPPLPLPGVVGEKGVEESLLPHNNVAAKEATATVVPTLQLQHPLLTQDPHTNSTQVEPTVPALPLKPPHTPTPVQALEAMARGTIPATKLRATPLYTATTLAMPTTTPLTLPPRTNRSMESSEEAKKTLKAQHNDIKMIIIVTRVDTGPIMKATEDAAVVNIINILRRHQRININNINTSISHNLSSNISSITIREAAKTIINKNLESSVNLGSRHDPIKMSRLCKN